MNIVSLHDVHKAFGDRVLLNGVSLGLSVGEKVGLVGANGCGKSTLFRILAGLDAPDRGRVAHHRDLTAGYLSQEPMLKRRETARAAVASGMAALEAARAEATDVAAELERNGSNESACAELLERYERLQREIERLGGWHTEHVVEEMLTHLGVLDVADRVVDELSGGQRRRVALAQVLLMKPGLLVLDEPTNHLDADTVDWLEGALRASSSAVALITHDRYFLDRVATRMWELEDGAVWSLPGNYTTYLERKRERMVVAQQTESRRLKLLDQELAWLHRSPAARTGKQKARAKRIDTLMEPTRGAGAVHLELDLAPEHKLEGDTVLNAIGLTAGYGDHLLVRDLTLRVLRGERVGIIGPNGCGKTTLLKALLGLLPLQAGRLEMGSQTRIGYFDQERAGIDPDATLLRAVAPNSDHVRVGGGRRHVRGYLQDFLFPVSEHGRRVATLSGGERSRLLLARLVAQGANLIVLDEPTNDLDLPTLQVLEDALARFEGCLLMVTHDRYFLNRVANRILAFVGDGEVRSYAGDYDLYRKTRAAEQSAAAADARGESAAAAREAPAPRPKGLSRREEAKLATLEDEIAALEGRKARLEALLAQPDRMADEPGKLDRLVARHGEAGAALEAAYERWAELMERKETADDEAPSA